MSYILPIFGVTILWLLAGIVLVGIAYPNINEVLEGLIAEVEANKDNPSDELKSEYKNFLIVTSVFLGPIWWVYVVLTNVFGDE